MITIKNLFVSYDANKVIRDLNLSMAENGIHGIVGLNGAGKTTLLNTFFGLKKQDSGTIALNGEKMTKKKMSYLMTENYYYSGITGEEYLSLFVNPAFNIEKWNQLFHLPLERMIDEYSTGMKKKLALMGVLKHDKPVMILDEPFNSLDIETCRIIRSILLRLKDRSRTIIITSHIIETLTNLCDFIHYLEGGTIKFTKTPSEFPQLEKDIFETIEMRNEGKIGEAMNS